MNLRYQSTLHHHRNISHQEGTKVLHKVYSQKRREKEKTESQQETKRKIQNAENCTCENLQVTDPRPGFSLKTVSNASLTL